MIIIIIRISNIIPVFVGAEVTDTVVEVWIVVVAVVVFIVDITFVLSSAITGSEGTANSTVQAATLSVNGVISCQVPFLSMNGAISEFGMLHG